MRILYVLNGFDPGGAEHGLLRLVENGAFDGHDLRVLAFCRGRGDLADRVVGRLGQRVRFVTNAEKLTFRACVAGFFSILGSVLSFRPQKMVLSLKQANLVGRLAALVVPGLTCVAFEHIAEYRARRFERIYGPLLRLLSARVDEVWADCHETLEETHRYFRPRRRAEHVIPLFAAEERAPFKTGYSARTGPPARGGRQGRAAEEHPVDDRGRTRSPRPRYRCDADVYGEDAQEQALETLIAQHGLQGRVTLHGYRADWVGQAAGADIFLNLSGVEGFCIVVAEAMLAGLPVVAVDVGGIREYGRDGENMSKLRTANAAAARAAIVRLVGDPLLRERLGRQARLDMLRDYNPAACRRRVMAALV